MKQYDISELDTSDVKVLYFSSSWCGPCKQLGPQLDDLEKEFEEEDVSFRKIMIDDLVMTDIIQEYKIRSIPALIFLHHDKEANRIIGLQPVTAIADAIDTLLEDEF